MSTTYSQRLQDVMSKMEPPVDRKALADAMGITVQALGNVLRGEVKKINYRQAAGAARFLGVDLAWLVGEEQLTVNHIVPRSISVGESPLANFLPLPPLPRMSVDYRAIKMSVLDYNRFLFDFRKALPQEWQQYAGVKVPNQHQDREVYFDYASPFLMAMVIPVMGTTVGKPVTECVLELVAARQADTVGRELVLLFIDAMQVPDAIKMTPAAHDVCRLFGIRVIVCKTSEEAAQVIHGLEEAIHQSMAQQ
jgi:transcriptional regulator with XRE-family HTH domain